MVSTKGIFVVALVGLAIAYWYNPFKTVPKIVGPIVETKYGKVRGLETTSRSGKAFYEFLGIPYAAPPVGERRFETPVPPDSWEGIKEANAYGSKCLQLEMIGGRLSGSEDCLFLNVFTPKKRYDGDKGFPVMVFIHGGAFVTGSANNYGPRYFLDEEVVLVTINYRLAALGFLNTGSDGVVRGNMGLKDQVRALMWVKGNIKAFGGNPDSVTIFGESAGAASVQLHILSPLTKGLFHKGIAQSGTSINHWATFKKPKEQAQRYAAKFNCPIIDSKEMVACLKKIDAETFTREHVEMTLPLRDPITLFAPTVEYFKDNNAFLTDDPMKILKGGKFQKIPLISGVNSEEGLLSASVITANQTKLDEANSKWTWWVSKILNLQENEEVAQKIRHFYFSGKENIATKEYLRSYTNMFSDRMFFWATHTHALIYAKHAPVRLYYYTHQGDFSLAPILASTQGRFPIMVNVAWDIFVRWFNSYFFNSVSPHMGVCHADEIALFFNIQILDLGINPGDKDYHLSSELVKLWTTFARQDQSESLEFKDVIWPVNSIFHLPLKYMRLDNDAAMVEEPFLERVKFWESLNITL